MEGFHLPELPKPGVSRKRFWEILAVKIYTTKESIETAKDHSSPLAPFSKSLETRLETLEEIKQAFLTGKMKEIGK